MENAVDALKMAGAVLIFVMALSVSIVAFGQVRETADIILDYKDRETFYIDGDYYYGDKSHELISQNGKESYKIGDRIFVKVKDVSIPHRTVNFYASKEEIKSIKACKRKVKRGN